MRGGQVLRRVEFPCALPLIFSGVRNASLQVIATATVASEIGLGGLGRYIIDGISAAGLLPETAPGAVLVAALALVVDLLWALVAPAGRVARAVRPVPALARCGCRLAASPIVGCAAIAAQPVS